MAAPREQGQSGYINPVSGYNYSVPNTFGTAAQPAAQPQTDWLPSRDLDLPDWPADDQNTDAAHDPSSVFSPGIFTPESEDSWNYFESYFKDEPQASPLASTTAAIDLAQGSPQAASVSYIPLSLINSPPALVAQDEDDTSDITDEAFYSNKSSSSQTMREGPLQSPRKPAWGDPSRQSPKLGRRSFRITEKQNTSSRRKSFPSSSNGHQLRGVKARPRMAVDKDAEAEEIPLPRVAHNMVEKQYRTRLNTQFTNLLNALPPEVIGAEFDGYVDSGGCRGKVSKGDVLVFAKRYIQALEQEKKNLEGQTRKYEEDIRHLREAWVRSGGQPLV